MLPYQIKKVEIDHEPIAIIGDIHANRQGLDAVLSDVPNGIKIINLGDIIGYCSDPVYCLEKSAGFFANTKGNHDVALSDPELRGEFNNVAKANIEWTKKVLEEQIDRNRLYANPDSLGGYVARGFLTMTGRFNPKSKIVNYFSFLHDLPKTLVVASPIGNIVMVHGTPASPITDYACSDEHIRAYSFPTEAERSDALESNRKKIPIWFDNIGYLGVTAHTHVPGLLFEDGEFLAPTDLPSRNGYNVYKMEEGRKALVNVGSVGVPRDGMGASYVILEGENVLFRRVAFDVKATLRDIRKRGVYKDSEVTEEEIRRLFRGI